MTMHWPTVDPLGAALYFLRMSGLFYTRSELGAPWGLGLPALPDTLMFHVVTEGQCWLEVEGAEPMLLQPDTFTLVPHGQGHRLASEPGELAAPLFELPRLQVSERYEILRHGGGGMATAMVCGAVRFEHPAARQLVALLPRVICTNPASGPPQEWLQSTLRFLAAEAGELRPGGETIITRLADILVVQAIRSWITADPGAQRGWLGALQDRQLGPALAAIHRDPAHGWSVASLAQEALMSRSAFAARFTELVGEPVMQYVTRWRMYLALQWLEDERATQSEVALRLGYQSEAAFSRAFKRLIGERPGVARRRSVHRLGGVYG
ncbi:MAG: AraC family transcriptional regulator [Chloroflexales bacterium]|nr:AraC family transcriptional regulator [Chloroflexales bacterium]